MKQRDDKGRFTSDKEPLTGVYREMYEAYAGRMVGVQNMNERTVQARKVGARAWLSFLQDEEIHPFDATERDARKYLDGKKKQHVDTFMGTLYSGINMFYEGMMNNPDFDTGLDESPAAGINFSKDYNITNLAEYIQIHVRDRQTNIKALPMERVEKLYGNAPGNMPESKTRNELIVRLFATTALRADELARVRLDNVDTQNRIITVRSSKLDPELHKDLYIRSVPYPDSVQYLMHKWVHYQRDSFSKHAASSNYLLLPPQHEGPLSASYLSRLVKDTAVNAEEQEPLRFGSDGEVAQWLITAHRLRHSAISHWINELKIPIAHASWAAGHAQIDTTMAYAEPDWKAMKESFETGFQNN